MTRFFLSAEAQQDLADVRQWLGPLPDRPALKVGRSLQRALNEIAKGPLFSPVDRELTRLAKQEVRSRNAGDYRIYYRFSGKLPEMIAILHHARDAATILPERLQ